MCHDVCLTVRLPPISDSFPWVYSTWHILGTFSLDGTSRLLERCPTHRIFLDLNPSNHADSINKASLSWLYVAEISHVRGPRVYSPLRNSSWRNFAAYTSVNNWPSWPWWPIGKKCVLGLATGSTPMQVYRKLVKSHKEGLSFRHVTTFNLDEYFPMKADALQSYHRFMHEHLFSHIDIQPGNIHIPDGDIEPSRIQQ